MSRSEGRRALARALSCARRGDDSLLAHYYRQFQERRQEDAEEIRTKGVGRYGSVEILKPRELRRGRNPRRILRKPLGNPGAAP